MIVADRLTGAEIDVLTDALIEYRNGLEAFRIRSRNTQSREDCVWRLHVVAEILDTLELR